MFIYNVELTFSNLFITRLLVALYVKCSTNIKKINAVLLQYIIMYGRVSVDSCVSYYLSRQLD